MSGQSASELNSLSRKRFELGDFHGCISWAEQAEMRASQSTERVNELWAIELQCLAWANMGNIKKGLEAATRLIYQARSYGEERYLMTGTRLLATRAAEIDLRNRWHEIRPILLEGLEIARRTRDNFEEVYHLMRLGDFAVQIGEEEQGYAWLQNALNAFKSDLPGQGYLRTSINTSLANLMCKREDYAEAVRYAEIAIGSAREDGNPLFVANSKLTLAKVKRACGELAESVALIDELLPHVREMGWKADEQSAEYLRGELMRDLGYAEASEVSARNALELSVEMQCKEEEVKSLLSLGKSLLALGKKEEARDAWQQALQLSQERGYIDYSNTAEKLLLRI